MGTGHSDHIAELLRARIRKGEWPARFKIPPERELSTEFKVARNTVRRALDELEQEDLIRREVGRGTFVRSVLDRTPAMFQELVAGSKPFDVLEVRLALEPYATAIAADTSDEGRLADIRMAHAAFRDASNPTERAVKDVAFHQAIAQAAGNAMIVAVLSLADYLDAHHRVPDTHQVVESFADHQDHMAHHQAVVTAIERQEPELAYRTMLNHLTLGVTAERTMVGVSEDVVETVLPLRVSSMG